MCNAWLLSVGVYASNSTANIFGYGICKDQLMLVNVFIVSRHNRHCSQSIYNAAISACISIDRIFNQDMDNTGIFTGTSVRDGHG